MENYISGEEQLGAVAGVFETADQLIIDRSIMKPFMTEVIIMLRKSMDWFLYDNGPRHKRVKLVKTHH